MDSHLFTLTEAEKFEEKDLEYNWTVDATPLLLYSVKHIHNTQLHRSSQAGLAINCAFRILWYVSSCLSLCHSHRSSPLLISLISGISVLVYGIHIHSTIWKAKLACSWEEWHAKLLFYYGDKYSFISSFPSAISQPATIIIFVIFWLIHAYLQIHHKLSIVYTIHNSIMSKF